MTKKNFDLLKSLAIELRTTTGFLKKRLHYLLKENIESQTQKMTKAKNVQ